MVTVSPHRNKILPLDIANVIFTNYDSTLNIVDEAAQIYGKALDGKGVVEYKNGNRYEGEFNNGMLHGKGTFTWPNMITYTGEFSENQITGSGRYEWPDGSIYEGEVLMGLRCGKGKFTTGDEACEYVGEWKDGLKHGKGVLTFRTGTVYEGEFERGLKHGYGKIVYASGNIYEGYWAFDKKEGQGTMQWVAANEIYRGSWFDNKQEGWGEHIWLEPKGEGKFLRNRYEGEWKNGMRNGIGVFYYGNGSKYEGEWVDNLKEGFAVFTHEDGKVFKGLYKNDKIAVKKEGQEEADVADVADVRKTQDLKGLPLLSSPSKKDKITAQSIELHATPSKKTPKKPSGTPHSTEKQFRVTGRIFEIEKNVYDTLIDVSDLFVEEEDEEMVSLEMKELKKLLLRHHQDFKSWYRHYSEKQPVNQEETFALTVKMFWKILRDARILSPKITIASFNRLFLQGSKNFFPLHTSKQILRKNLFIAKREYLDSLPAEERAAVNSQIEEVPQDELLLADKKVDIHDENRVLLFRHFVDAIVRVAFLKYGGAPNFAKKAETVINKIQANMETKKKLKSQVEEESILVRTRGLVEELKERLKNSFQQMPAKEQSFVFEEVDYTMTVKRIIEVFETTGIIKDDTMLNTTLHSAERVYDTDDLYISINENSRDKSQLQQSLLAKTDKLGALLSSEVIFLEFYDIFLLTLFRKEGLTLKEEEVKRRALVAIEAIEEYLQESKNFKEDLVQRGPDIQWPYSQKDYSADHLSVEKERREKELMSHREKRLETENQEREMEEMEREDIDIIDEIQKPASKRATSVEIDSGVLVDSFNDF